jgi:peptide/nickel transport system permease protein
MIRLLVRRVLFGLLVLWVVATLVFILYFVAPKDVARTIAGRQASEQTVALVERRLGLDQPLHIQYARYLGRLSKGDLGVSYLDQAPVMQRIRRDIPVTMSLALGAAVLWLIMGVSAGVLAARKPRSAADQAVTVTSLFFYSMPTFLLGQLFLLFLFYFLTTKANIRWFPPSGYVPLTENPFEWARHLILPWFALALVSAATYTRLTRGAMLDVLGEDYIRTARAKGLSERRITFRHALRAALAPISTQLGIDVGVLLGGAVVTEQVFGLPGLGREAVLAITREDLPIIMGIAMLASFTVVVASILVDLTYALIDPRVRTG